jgi:hypothetical protein
VRAKSLGRSGSIRKLDLADVEAFDLDVEGHDLHGPRPTETVGVSCGAACAICCRMQRSDVVVAQCVVDELDLAPGRGDHADVVAASVRDPVPDDAHASVGRQHLHRFEALHSSGCSGRVT